MCGAAVQCCYEAASRGQMSTCVSFVKRPLLVHEIDPQLAQSRHTQHVAYQYGCLSLWHCSSDGAELNRAANTGLAAVLQCTTMPCRSLVAAGCQLSAAGLTQADKRLNDANLHGCWCVIALYSSCRCPFCMSRRDESRCIPPPGTLDGEATGAQMGQGLTGQDPPFVHSTHAQINAEPIHECHPSASNFCFPRQQGSPTDWAMTWGRGGLPRRFPAAVQRLTLRWALWKGGRRTQRQSLVGLEWEWRCGARAPRAPHPTVCKSCCRRTPYASSIARLICTSCRTLTPNAPSVFGLPLSGALAGDPPETPSTHRCRASSTCMRGMQPPRFARTCSLSSGPPCMT